MADVATFKSCSGRNVCALMRKRQVCAGKMHKAPLTRATTLLEFVCSVVLELNFLPFKNTNGY